MINLRAVVYISSHVRRVNFPFGVRSFSTTTKWLKKGGGNHPGVLHYKNVAIEKLDILKDNLLKSGVYMFTTLTNGKRYIGSTGNLSRRLSEYLNTNYLIRANTMVICNALLKHGYSNFSLDILEFCEVSDLLAKEKYYWDIFKPEYNVAKDPLAPMTGRNHTDETRNKISKALFGKLAGENNHMFGKTHSAETRKKLSEINSGTKHHMFGKKHSDITRQKLSEARKTIKVEVFDVLKNETVTYNSIQMAVDALKLPKHSIISNYLIRNQKRPYKGQYIFKKVEDSD